MFPGEHFATYNFEVADFHTYFVAPKNSPPKSPAVWVHNNGGLCPEGQVQVAKELADAPSSGFIRPAQSKIDSAVLGLKPEDAQLVRNTVDAIYENRAWKWKEIGKAVQKGTRGFNKKRKQVRKTIIENNLIPKIEYEGKFADFDNFAVRDTYLVKYLWGVSDSIQFRNLDSVFGGKINGYTWHHHHEMGRMILIPMGLHRFFSHHGGRSKGNWAYVKGLRDK